MANTTNRLTAVGIKNLKEKGLYADGGGLYLRITDSGTKGWIFRFSETVEPAIWALAHAPR